MTGLAPKTLKVFKDISTLSCIQEYVLVGGTALSLQINHRLSEYLDFCKWSDTSSAKSGIPFKQIHRELKDKFQKVEVNPLDFNQADFFVNGEVKLQFFNEIGYTLPTQKTIALRNNLKIAPIETIGAMKIKTMFQLNVFRDYYDTYAIVKGGHLSLKHLINLSCTYNSKLQSKAIINRLLLYAKFNEEKNFGLLSPKYNVSSHEIGGFFKAESSNLF